MVPAVPLLIAALCLACAGCGAPARPGSGPWRPSLPRQAGSSGPAPVVIGSQRASFAADTTTVDDGYADIELGLGWDPRDLVDVPLNLNVGVGPRTEAYLGAMVTLPAGDWIWSGFYQLGAVGEDGGGRWDSQHAVSFSAGYRVHDSLGLYAELVGIRTHEQDLDELFVIAGAHHVLSDQWMVDWGAQAGLNDDAPPTQLILGFTRSLGRWRPER